MTNIGSAPPGAGAQDHAAANGASGGDEAASDSSIAEDEAAGSLPLEDPLNEADLDLLDSLQVEGMLALICAEEATVRSKECTALQPHP